MRLYAFRYIAIGSKLVELVLRQTGDLIPLNCLKARSSSGLNLNPQNQSPPITLLHVPLQLLSLTSPRLIVMVDLSQ